MKKFRSQWHKRQQLCRNKLSKKYARYVDASFQKSVDTKEELNKWGKKECFLKEVVPD